MHKLRSSKTMKNTIHIHPLTTCPKGILLNSIMIFWLFVLAAGFLVTFLSLNRPKNYSQPEGYQKKYPYKQLSLSP